MTAALNMPELQPKVHLLAYAPIRWVEWHGFLFATNNSKSKWLVFSRSTNNSPYTIDFGHCEGLKPVP